MNNKTLTVPIITPMKDGKVDYGSFTSMFNYLVENSVNSILLFGTTGEFQHLSYEQKAEILDHVSKLTSNTTNLLLGISSDTTDEMMKLLSLGNNYEIDANVLTPLYGEGATESKVDMVLETSDKPVILYNNPNIQGGKNMDLDLIKQIVGNEQIIGFKDTSGDNDYFRVLVDEHADKMKIYQGREKTMLDTLDMDIAGIISGNANAYPKEFSDMITDPSPENVDKVFELKTGLSGLSDNYIQAMKIFLKKAGVISSEELVR